MTTIMPIDEPVARGTVYGERVGGSPLDSADNYFICNRCAGWIDARDLGWVLDHETELPHPSCDGV